MKQNNHNFQYSRHFPIFWTRYEAKSNPDRLEFPYLRTIPMYLNKIKSREISQTRFKC